MVNGLLVRIHAAKRADAVLVRWWKAATPRYLLAPARAGAFLCGIPLRTLVTEPLANGKTADLPGLDDTAQIALATAVDLADSALPRKIDDHVTFAGMETDPGQETDKPPIVAA